MNLVDFFIENKFSNYKISIELSSDDFIVFTFSLKHKSRIKTYITIKDYTIIFHEYEKYTVYEFPAHITLPMLKNINTSKLYNGRKLGCFKWNPSLALRNVEYYLLQIKNLSLAYQGKKISAWYHSKKNYIEQNVKNSASWKDFIISQVSFFNSLNQDSSFIKELLINIGYEEYNEALKHAIILKLISKSF